MGRAIKTIQHAVSDVTQNPGADVGAGLAAGLGPLGMAAGAGVGSIVQNAMNPGPGPQAPGINPALSSLQQQQLQNAAQFRANLPSTQQTLDQNLKVSANQGLSSANANTRQNNSARGLLYSNINTGQQQANNARSKMAVAQGTSDINSGLMNAANTLDAQAIETGVGIQQTSQAIQNDIYSQAMARMNAQNSVVGSGLGLVATGGLLAAKG